MLEFLLANINLIAGISGNLLIVAMVICLYMMFAPEIKKDAKRIKK